MAKMALLMQLQNLSSVTKSFQRLSRISSCIRPLSTGSDTPPKPYTSIPKKKGLRKYLDYFGPKPHEIALLRYKELGPIFRETLPSPSVPNVLVVCDPDNVEAVIRADGKWPYREAMPIWSEVRQSLSMPKGIFLLNHEEWYNERKPMSQFMMKPIKVQEQSPVFNQITDDLIKAIRHLRDHDTSVLSDVPKVFFNWSFESVAFFVLGKRLGALDIDNMPPDCQEFISVIQEFFTASQELLFSLPLYKLYPTKTWQKLKEMQIKGYQIGLKFINDRIREVKEKEEGGRGETNETLDFLTYMIENSGLTLDEISINALDLLGAGVDTTSYTLSWCLYCLATNPDVQGNLRQEVSRVVGDAAAVTPDHIHQLPYLRYCIKEALRLYPVAPNNIRILTKDIVLSGYQIPKGTNVMLPTYTMGRLPHLFPDPLSYKPERWDRSEGSQTPRYSSLPFGTGPRMCVGRRVAELELHITLARVIGSFNVAYLDEKPMEPTLKILLSPKTQLNLRFEDIK